jgi:hypothetical protein
MLVVLLGAFLAFCAAALIACCLLGLQIRGFGSDTLLVFCHFARLHDFPFVVMGFGPGGFYWIFFSHAGASVCVLVLFLVREFKFLDCWVRIFVVGVCGLLGFWPATLLCFALVPISASCMFWHLAFCLFGACCCEESCMFFGRWRVIFSLGCRPYTASYPITCLY